MEDTAAPVSARIAVAKIFLELTGDIGKLTQPQRNCEQNLAEIKTEERICQQLLTDLKLKKQQYKRILALFYRVLFILNGVIAHITYLF